MLTEYQQFRTEANHPVLVWIHGGSLIFGSANEAVYDGGSLASRGDVVFVGIDYRLGHFGWLGLNPNTSRDGEGNGNYGLGDMITALQWIKKNIKYFGGDASKVTIMGSSGGAIAVRALLASKKTKGLISGAIIQSGAWSFSPAKAFSEYPTIAESISGINGDVISGLGCGGLDTEATLSCMRSLDGQTISATAAVSYPLIDKFLLNGDLGVNGNGYAISAPLMIGVVRDELAPWNSGLYGTTGVLDYLTQVAPALFDEDLTPLATSPAFPLPPDAPTQAEAAFNVSTRIITDYGMTCITWATAYSLEKHDIMPAIYAYSFNRTYQPVEWSPPMCSPPTTAEKPGGDFDMEYYKCHGSETLVMFGTEKYSGLPDRDGLDILFSQYSVDLWASFARTGNPNPDVNFLRARGYFNTLGRVDKTGKWNKLDRKRQDLKFPVRVLQWDSHDDFVTEVPQCDALGMPLDYYEV
ncbi:Acetylcholinesterase [Dactylella cylindrospora]|nr:Acetylcholinesterase [Dactylella cylindrospora]